MQSKHDLSEQISETVKNEPKAEKTSILGPWKGRFDLESAKRLLQDMHALKSGTLESYDVLFWRLVHMAASTSDHESLGTQDDAMNQQTTSRALRFYRELIAMHQSGVLRKPQVQLVGREQKRKLGLSAVSCGLTMRKLQSFLAALAEIFEILKMISPESGFPFRAKLLISKCGVRIAK